MSYYPQTCKEIRGAISLKLQSSCSDLDGKLLRYLLFMADEIEKMNPASLKDAFKAARWLGWMLKAMEELGFWDNERSRDLVRSDVKEEDDRPRGVNESR